MDKCVKLFVIGKQNLEKKALIEVLINDTSTLPSSPHPPLSQSTQPSVLVHHWKTQTGAPNEASNMNVTIDVWDIPDENMYLEVIFSSLTCPGLFLVLCQADESDWDGLKDKISLIDCWFPGSCVIISLHQTYQCDNKEVTKILESLNRNIHDWVVQKKMSLKKHLSDIKSTIKEARATCRNKNIKFKGRSSFNTLLSSLRQDMKNIIMINEPVNIVDPFNGFGISALKDTIISKVLNEDIFPHLKTDSIMNHVMLSDVRKTVLDLHDLGNIFIPWPLRYEIFNCKNLSADLEIRDELMENVMKQLEAEGQIKVLHLLPVEVQEKFYIAQSNCCSQCGRYISRSSLFIDKNKTHHVCFHSYICTSPEVFANILFDCFVPKDRKIFSLEANKYWPKDSGFKAPDPETLAWNLNLIPTKGIIIESLFPLLWQEHNLSQTQIQYVLDVLQGLGILTVTTPIKTDCAGLAMPDYPCLSPVTCYSLICADILPDTKPQLNWSLRPFPGDLQVTWKLIGLSDNSKLCIKRILGTIHWSFKNICDFTYLWNQGTLIKFKNNLATVCVEQSSNCLEVSCRVSGDDPGEETSTAMLLWAHLIPVIQAVEHFLSFFLPGIHYKNNLVVLGDVFYNNEQVAQEPELSLFKLLVAKRSNSYLTVEDEKSKATLNLELLFPFNCDDLKHVWTPKEWIEFVMKKYDEILKTFSPHINTVLRNHPLTSPLTRKRYKKRRKFTEVRWSHSLSEEVKVNSITSLDSTEDAFTTIIENKEETGEEIMSEESENKHEQEATVSEPLTKTEGTQTQIETMPAVSDEVWLKEALCVASKFVAAVMASGVAKYIATCGTEGLFIITAAEIAVAQVTADAALAVYNNDLHGAAKAVVKVVKSLRTKDTKNHPSSSRFCLIL